MSRRATRPQSSRALSATVGASLFVAGLGLSSPARANGALPATIQILLPPAAPKTIVIATNFGLVTSRDDGVTWEWICEHDQSLQGKAYQLGGPPTSRVLALATPGLVLSDDLGCNWSVALDQSTAVPVDYFPDPTNPNRALTLAIQRDGQRTFAVMDLNIGAKPALPPSTLFTAPMGEDLTTVELARSNPKVIYTTLITPSSTASARLARTEDAGVTWTIVTPTPEVTDLGIVAVDPADPDTLYFRVITDEGDKIAMSHDGGKTLNIFSLPAGGILSAFVRLPNGHVLLGWLDINDGVIFKSTDGGLTFMALPTTIHPRVLAERNGHVYTATDPFVDGFALAVSDDEGASWKRVMGFEDVSAIAACGQATSTCASSCAALAARKTFVATVCEMPRPPVDAGTDGRDAGPDGLSADAGESKVPMKSGCTCQAGTPPATPGGVALMIVGVSVVFFVIRTKRRRNVTS